MRSAEEWNDPVRSGENDGTIRSHGYGHIDPALLRVSYHPSMDEEGRNEVVSRHRMYCPPYGTPQRTINCLQIKRARTKEGRDMA